MTAETINAAVAAAARGVRAAWGDGRWGPGPLAAAVVSDPDGGRFGWRSWQLVPVGMLEGVDGLVGVDLRAAGAAAGVDPGTVIGGGYVAEGQSMLVLTDGTVGVCGFGSDRWWAELLLRRALRIGGLSEGWLSPWEWCRRVVAVGLPGLVADAAAGNAGAVELLAGVDRARWAAVAGRLGWADAEVIDEAGRLRGGRPDWDDVACCWSRRGDGAWAAWAGGDGAASACTWSAAGRVRAGGDPLPAWRALVADGTVDADTAVSLARRGGLGGRPAWLAGGVSGRAGRACPCGSWQRFDGCCGPVLDRWEHAGPAWWRWVGDGREPRLAGRPVPALSR